MSVAKMETESSPIPKYKRKDFQSDQDVRWCPGCGDYAILAVVQKVLSDLPVRREDHVFISGIGCSSRFPYYMNTYGFHTIHGRAPAFASGVKATNPNLHTWLVTGDGDALSIGGNHIIHLLRRNLNINILLFNNRIYGLTKGQYSPTSEVGKRTKSSPMGSLDYPFNPLAVALGANASFVARTVDTDAKHLSEVLMAAWEHPGTSFVEIYQNCLIFNDGAFDTVVDKGTRDDNQLRLEAGEKMVFGAARNRGVIRRDGELQVATIGQDGVTLDDVVVHDPGAQNPGTAFQLAWFDVPNQPVPMGVLRRTIRPTYEQMMHKQLDQARAKNPPNLEALLNSGYTWTVE